MFIFFVDVYFERSSIFICTHCTMYTTAAVSNKLVSSSSRPSRVEKSKIIFDCVCFVCFQGEDACSDHCTAMLPQLHDNQKDNCSFSKYRE